MVGLAPFAVSRRRVGPTVYESPGARSLPRIEPVCRPERETVFARAVAQSLVGAEPTPSVIRIVDADTESPWPSAIAAAWPKGGLARLRWSHIQPVPMIEVERRPFSVWWELRSGRFRADVRRGRRKLSGRGASVVLASDSVAFDRAAKGLAHLHALRWPSELTAAPQNHELLRDVADDLLPRGKIRLWTLEIDGAIIAANLMTAAGGEVVGVASAFDARFKRLQPGLHLQLAAIEHCFAAGDRRIDLGLGPSWWKRRLANGERQVGSAVVIPSGVRQLPARAWERLDALAVAAARRLPERATAELPRVIGPR